MGRFSYLVDKIKAADFSDTPFSHIQIDDFFSKKDFSAILSCSEIATPKASSDQQLISELKSRGYKVIDFPGCVTNVKDYIKWHSNKDRTTKTHSACEGFGMVMRLYEKDSQILKDLEAFLLSEEFNSVIAEKFGIKLSDCKIDGGIQKYLDGYEISPHPDIRRKAATYMVNINPSEVSESADHHTHYLKFKNSKKYIYDFWANNTEYDRDWVPWDWCETVKQQRKNNSIVIFAPSNDTVHAVKANYDHLITQRTQLYGNLWYLESKTKPLKWERLQIPNNDVRSPGTGLSKKVKAMLPTGVKSLAKRMLRKQDDIGQRNIN